MSAGGRKTINTRRSTKIEKDQVNDSEEENAEVDENADKKVEKNVKESQVDPTGTVPRSSNEEGNLNNVHQLTGGGGGGQEFIFHQATMQAQSTGLQGQSIFLMNANYPVFNGPPGTTFVPPNMYACVMPYQFPSVSGLLTAGIFQSCVVMDADKSSIGKIYNKEIDPDTDNKLICKLSCEKRIKELELDNATLAESNKKLKETTYDEKKVKDLELKINKLIESNRKLKSTNQHLNKTNQDLAVQLDQLHENERIVDRLSNNRASSHYEIQRGSRGGSGTRGFRGYDSKHPRSDRL